MTTRQRDDAIDCTKAIAMFAVTVFHVTRGFVAAGLIEDAPWLRIADAVAYSFHIQAFLLVSGYLAYRSAGSLRVQLERQSFLYYAYLLWSLVYWPAAYAMSGSVNHPPSYESLYFIPVLPTQHFWFLLALMAGTALLAVLRSSFALCAGILLIPLLTGYDLVGRYNFLFYVVFMLIGGLLRERGYIPRIVPALAVGGGLAVVALGWLSVTQDIQIAHPLAILPMLAGVYACYGLGKLLTTNDWTAAIARYCGQRTMPIYLLHVAVAAALRIVLFRIVPDFNVWLAMLLCILAGFAVPLIVEQLARRAGLTVLLGFEPWKFASHPRRTGTA